jgi:4-amino-4-deoxy-L-arabinose transferase-like glycosyltransferase
LKKTTENIWWAFAFLLVVIACFFGLFIDLTGDSGLYAAISRQMVESGDWFNLKINGTPYDQKPHLFFWLAGLGIQLFGNSNFAFKLFPFIYGVAGIYFTYRLGKQLFSDEAGKWAALIAGTSQIFFLYFFDFHTDSVLQTGVTLALWQLAAYLQHKKWSNFILGFTGIGLAMLSKGPVGAILPFFAVLLYLLAERDFRQLFRLKWFLGIMIVLIIISPSLVHLYNSFGITGLKFYFITNNVGRITGSYAGSSNDYFFYVYNALWAFLPWTVFVVAAIFTTIKNWFTSKSNSGWTYYLLASVLILMVILSIAKGKAPNYFLIAVAPVSVVSGGWLASFDTLPQRKKRLIFTLQIFVIILSMVFFVFAAVIYSTSKIWLPLVLFFISIIVILVITKSPILKLNKIVLVSIILTGAFNLFMNAKVLPHLFAYQGPRQVLEIYEKQNSSQKQLYNFELEEYSLFFYAREQVTNVDNWDYLYEIMAKPGTWIYTNEIKYNDIMKMDYNIDTVYQIRQRGMNRINEKFINPKTRDQSLKTNYLIVIRRKNNE